MMTIIITTLKSFGYINYLTISKILQGTLYVRKIRMQYENLNLDLKHERQINITETLVAFSSNSEFSSP